MCAVYVCDQERQDGVAPDRKMKVLKWFHSDRSALLLCCFFGGSLILTYQKLLHDQGLLKHRRFEERELFQILDNHRLSNDSTHDKWTTIGDRWDKSSSVRRSLAVRSIKTSGGEDFNETSVPDTPVNRNKYLIYLCNRQKLCGSWAERQVAIVSTFILANLTNRIFMVSMTSPCRVQNFLIPREYNWLPDIEKLRGKPFTVISDDRNSTFLQTLQYKDFNTVYSHDTVFIRATTDFVGLVTQNPFYKNKLQKWMLQKNKEVFKTVWEMLMTPSENVHNTLSELRAGTSLFKFGEILCFYVQTRNVTISQGMYQELIARFSEQFVNQAANLFIATDSSEFRNVTRTKFGSKCLDSGGAILDIDKERFSVDSCYALETVILDQLILTKCEVLVISKTRFGEITSVLKRTHRDLFGFGDGTVYPLSYND